MKYRKLKFSVDAHKMAFLEVDYKEREEDFLAVRKLNQFSRGYFTRADVYCQILLANLIKIHLAVHQIFMISISTRTAKSLKRLKMCLQSIDSRCCFLFLVASYVFCV